MAAKESDISGRENLPPLSKMARKFLNYRIPFREVKLDHPSKGFREELYFFYGTLMDPGTLAKILKLGDRPMLRPAKLIGYHCKFWGPYPALLDGPVNAAVHGMAYKVRSPKEVELLEAYETNLYTRVACRIRFEDGRTVRGGTFKWSADEGDLREGVFDLKDWQMHSLDGATET